MKYTPLTAKRFDVLKRGERIRRISDGAVFTCIGMGAEKLQFVNANGSPCWVVFDDGKFERIIDEVSK